MSRQYGLYIADIIEAIDKITEFTKGLDYLAFSKDDKTISAVIRKLEIIGEATKKIPYEITCDYPDIPWSLMAKLRDKLIHGYFEINLEIIWKTIQNKLPEVKVKLQSIKKDT